MKNKPETVYKIILKDDLYEDQFGFGMPYNRSNILKDTKIKKTFYAHALSSFNNTQIFILKDTEEFIIIPNNWILFMAPIAEEK